MLKLNFFLNLIFKHFRLIFCLVLSTKIFTEAFYRVLEVFLVGINNTSAKVTVASQFFLDSLTALSSCGKLPFSFYLKASYLTLIFLS